MGLAKLLTIPALARSLEGRGGGPMPRRTMFRTVMRLVERDEREGRSTAWLVRDGRPWRVNVSLLKVSHPELFDVRDPEEQARDIELLKKTQTTLAQRQTSLAVRVRQLSSWDVLGHLGPRAATGS